MNHQYGLRLIQKLLTTIPWSTLSAIGSLVLDAAVDQYNLIGDNGALSGAR